jgi:uncharacterized SAM-binding protein YcdF (DUF218 family)
MISRFLDPAFLGLVLVLVGLVGWTRTQPRRALLRWKILAWSGFGALWLAASPWLSNLLAGALEPEATDLASALAGTDPSRRALVVLAGGQRNTYDFLPAVERLDATTQARLLGAARVYRENGPFAVVIVTGTGIPYVSSMAEYLALHGVPKDRIALEPEATDTSTNATHSASILRKHDPVTVVLVTSALHIPRSVVAFRKAGIEVVPAPVDYIGGQGWRLVPSSSAMVRTARSTHEILGRLEP